MAGIDRKRQSDREEILYGVHPVLEALTSRRRHIDRILVARERMGPSLGRLLRLAREAGIPISHLPKEVLSRRIGPRAVHQGVAAFVAAIAYADAEAMCRAASRSADGILVVLDGVEDPHNLGAVLRSATAAGACGVLLTGSGAAGLTPAVAKASAGTIERIPVAREARVTSRLQSLREAGFRIVALDPATGEGWDRVPLTGRLVLVAGSEGRGLRPSLLESSDCRVRIPLAAGVESLNVSVAVAVVLFESVRQRRAE
jgi:23S rRNA (guanosine2251-2'-O)-methyltransferase